MSSNQSYAELGLLADVVSGSGFPDRYQGQQDNELPFYKVSSLSGLVSDSEYRAEHTVSRRTASELGARVVPAGSVLMAKIGAALLLGRYAESMTECCIDNNMQALLPRDGVVTSRYLRYVMSQVPLNALVKDGPVPTVDVMGIKMWPVPHHDLPTQQRIADYLDRETGEIEAMIAKMDELAGQLEARRDAVVRTVLREGARGGRRISLQALGQIGSGEAIAADDIKDEGEYPVFGGNGQRGFSNVFNQTVDRVLIGRQGALCGNVHLARAPFWASEHALVMRTYSDETDLRWLAYAARDLELGRLSTAAAQPGITASGVGRETVWFPTPAEQKRIAEHLDEVTGKIDAMLAKVAELKSLLTERRAALITDVVTGRKEVA